MAKLRQVLRGVWRPIAFLVAVAAVGVAADGVPFVQALHRYLAARPDLVRWLSVLAFNLAAVGLILLLAAYVLVQAGGEGASGQEAAQLVPVERERRGRRSRRRAQQQPSHTVTEVPESLRETLGALLHGKKHITPRGRRLLLSWLGAMCIALGVLGFAFLIGPPFVKLLVIAVAAGGAVSVVWITSSR